MTKNQKARKRANRSLKRQQQYRDRKAKEHEEFLARQAENDRMMFERLSMMMEDGITSDPTPYYAVKYADGRIPECDRVYMQGVHYGHR